MSIDTTTTSTDVRPALVLQVPLGDLLVTLKEAGVGYDPRPAVPVLMFTRFEAVGQVVNVSCFNYERHGESSFISEAWAEGAFLLPYKALLDLLVAAGKGTTKRIREAWRVGITVHEDHAEVTVNGTTYNLATGPVDEYPIFEPKPAQHEAVVDTVEFIRLMDAGVLATSKDPNVQILHAVELNFEAGQLVIYATDRYRLVQGTMPAVSMTEFKALIPAKAWKLLRKQLRTDIHSVIRVSEDGWVSICNQVESSILMPDGNFPRVRSLFPDSTPISLVMDADPLAAAVRSVAVAAERNTPVRFTYGPGVTMTADAGTGEDMQASASVPYSGDYAQEGFRVAFNPGYVTDGLSLFKGKTVIFGHTTAPKPAVLMAAGDDSLKYLIMPVRLPNQ